MLDSLDLESYMPLARWSNTCSHKNGAFKRQEPLRQSGVIGPFVRFASTALDFLIGPVLHKLRSVKITVKFFEISPRFHLTRLVMKVPWLISVELKTPQI